MRCEVVVPLCSKIFSSESGRIKHSSY